MSLKILGIDHVQITVPPAYESEAVSFYEDAVGLLRIDKPAALRSRGGAWFQAGNQQVHLGIEADADGNGSKRHLCILVDDAEAARRQLETAGIDIVEAPGEVDGVERFFVRDPAGNRLEIASR